MTSDEERAATDQKRIGALQFELSMLKQRMGLENRTKAEDALRGTRLFHGDLFSRVMGVGVMSGVNHNEPAWQAILTELNNRLGADAKQIAELKNKLVNANTRTLRWKRMAKKLRACKLIT